MENDQAEILRQEVLHKEQPETAPLPSRREVHGKQNDEKKKRTEKKEKKEKKALKPSFWLTRIVLAAFIVLVIFVLTYQYWAGNGFIPIHIDKQNELKYVDIER